MNELHELIQEAYEKEAEAWDAEKKAWQAEIKVWKNARNDLWSKNYLVEVAEEMATVSRRMVNDANGGARSVKKVSGYVHLPKIRMDMAEARAQQMKARDKMAEAWKGSWKRSWKLKAENAAEAWESAAQAWEAVGE